MNSGVTVHRNDDVVDRNGEVYCLVYLRVELLTTWAGVVLEAQLRRKFYF